MPIPLWNDVWDALRLLLAPAFGASVAVMLIVRKMVGERLAPLAASLAVAAGLFAGNYCREAFSWRIDNERTLNTTDLRLVLGGSLEGKPPSGDEATEEPLPLPPGRYWLPWLAGLAVLVDLLMRTPGVPVGAGWAARTLVALLAGRLLTPAYLRLEVPWASWALGVTILFEWAILTSLARLWKDGTTAATMALCCAAGGVIILYAHSALLADMAFLLFAALAGIAFISRYCPGDTGPALAAAAVYLPGLLLNGQQETFSQVPLRSFVLAGWAPLACFPLLLPFISRQQGWRRWLPGIVLPLIAATTAVVWAAQSEKLPF